MPTAILATALLSLAIWLYLAFARGNFWHLQPFVDAGAPHQPPPTWPSVVAIVPARNEAATIAQSVTSLLQQNYPGPFSVILVDDHSTDATVQIAQQIASELHVSTPLQIITASPLPAGWTGKLWALNTGAAISGCAPTNSLAPNSQTLSRTDPDNANAPTPPTYFWFTDADITHAPDTLSRLVSRAEQDHLDLTSLMVLLQAKSLSERALIPAFLFFFLKLYPPRWIANPNSRTAGAAGGCILLRSEALQKIGGLSAIRSEVIDDCALARALRQKGGSIWMGLTRSSISLRSYSTVREIQDLIARTAYTQLLYNPFLLLGTVAAMFLIYLAPVALLFAYSSATRFAAACACLLMLLVYLPTIRFYRLSPIWAATLPATALFYTYATALSAIRYHAGRGAQWKGRSQARPRKK